MTDAKDSIIKDKMSLLSREMEAIPGVLYKHDPYQVTIAAILVTLDRHFSICTLPTGSGKTFIIGLLYQYYKKHLKKSVIAVVPNEKLKEQMIN